MSEFDMKWEYINLDGVRVVCVHVCVYLRGKNIGCVSIIFPS